MGTVEKYYDFLEKEVETIRVTKDRSSFQFGHNGLALHQNHVLFICLFRIVCGRWTFDMKWPRTR